MAGQREKAGAGDSWEGTASFSGEEPYFRDHFPGFPVVPGVLLFEAMRKTSLQGYEDRGEKVRFVRVTHLRFVRPCIPPLDLRVIVRVDPEDELTTRCEVLNGDGKKVSTGRLYFERSG